MAVAGPILIPGRISLGAIVSSTLACWQRDRRCPALFDNTLFNTHNKHTLRPRLTTFGIFSRLTTPISMEPKPDMRDSPDVYLGEESSKNRQYSSNRCVIKVTYTYTHKKCHDFTTLCSMRLYSSNVKLEVFDQNRISFQLCGSWWALRCAIVWVMQGEHRAVQLCGLCKVSIRGGE